MSSDQERDEKARMECEAAHKARTPGTIEVRTQDLWNAAATLEVCAFEMESMRQRLQVAEAQVEVVRIFGRVSQPAQPGGGYVGIDPLQSVRQMALKLKSLCEGSIPQNAGAQQAVNVPDGPGTSYMPN